MQFYQNVVVAVIENRHLRDHFAKIRADNLVMIVVNKLKKLFEPDCFIPAVQRDISPIEAGVCPGLYGLLRNICLQ